MGPGFERAGAAVTLQQPSNEGDAHKASTSDMGEAMNARWIWFGLALGFLVLVALAPGLVTPTAGAQKARAEPRYAYKVVCFRYNSGERLGDDARAAQFERLLNDYARDGWEPVA